MKGEQMKKLTVVTIYGHVFLLTKTRMINEDGFAKYYTTRRELQKVLGKRFSDKNLNIVKFGIKMSDRKSQGMKHEVQIWNDSVDKSFNIGCQSFNPYNARIIRTWARSGK